MLNLNKILGLFVCVALSAACGDSASGTSPNGTGEGGVSADGSTDVAAGDGTASDGAAGDGTASDVAAGDVAASDGAASDGASGDVAAGDGASGDGAASDVAAGDGAAGDGSAGDGAASDVAASDVATGDGAAGDGSAGDGSAGDGSAGDGGSDVSCAAGSSLCGTNCVDTSNDVRNCGACANACATGARADAVCTAGRCALRCTEGFADCNGSAADGCEADLSAPESCGVCSVRCASATPLCVTSGTVRACGSGCAPTEARCGMTCVDTTRDPTDCGGCGVTCPTRANATATCAAGACGIRCSAGFADCDGDATNGCEADLSVATTCGACGARCAAATPLCAASGSTFACVSGCAAGQSRCDAGCADLQTSVTDCGTCGNACPAASNAARTCTSGRCGFTCAPGFADCNGSAADGCEADLSSPSTCGTCARACAGATPVCVGSGSAAVCGSGCPAGQARCAGSCVDVQTDSGNCGSCGMICATRANATVTCRAATCVSTCSAGFGDCDRNAANGCEASLLSDPFNCGGCGTLCSTGFCAAGVCTVPRNCDELHTALPTTPSGRYVIDPDGPGGAPSFTVFCDMATDGGGWTLIHAPDPTTSTGASGAVPYSINDATLRSISTRFLVSWRDATNTALPGWTRFGMIPSWRTASPFGALYTDETVSISIEGAAPRYSLLRYGLRGWAATGGGLCTFDWDNGFNRGRICFTDSTAPYYSGWSIGDGNYCSTSDGAYNATRCATDRRFTIAVGGTVCAGNTADCDRNATNGCEASLSTDPRNCGGCGTLCTSGTCAAGVCVNARSCDEIQRGSPGTASGYYAIDPDGPGGATPFSVYCDMTTLGGGWTVIQLANPTVSTGASGAVAYTVNDATLRSISTEVLVAYRDAANAVTPRWIRMGMPQSWRTASPFGALYTDETVSISPEGGAARFTLMRYGLRGWSAVGGGGCTTDWDNGFNRGRICFTDSTAPYYSGWSIGDGNYCSTSDGAYNATRCASDLRFSIAVRGQLCTGGTSDCDRLAGNGCEVNLTSDPNNCGGCGTVCTSGTCAAGVCVQARSCDELHRARPSAPSGYFAIDPDGMGGAAPFSVYCDMSTDGGGWTLIHTPPPTTSTGASGAVPYTINDATLRSISTQVLVAWRDASNGVLPLWARFGMIPSWRTASPFGSLSSNETVSLSTEGRTPRFTMLRYGLRGWSATDGGLCTADWDNGFNRGRICFTDTSAPYFSGWSIGDGNYCSASDVAYNTTRCAADRHFTIAVRGLTCSGGTADCDRDASNGCEVNLATDAFHCGGCGTVCTSGVCGAGACVPPRTCNELLAATPSAPSGYYTIDPDGPGGSAPLAVYCDMTTDGGGWTVIFTPPPTYSTGASGAVPYTINDATLRTLSTQVLVAWRDAANGILPLWARIGMPAYWRTASPFGALNTDETVAISIEGGAPRLTLLRYGLRGWSAAGGGGCNVDWDNGFNRGRICFTDTTAPYYSGWSIGDGNYCASSSGAYNATRCASDRRFTLAVR